jgi:tetratricopeptide (TPR) repeat protein
MKKVLLLIVAVSLTVFTFAQDAAEKINQANEALKAEDFAKAYQLYDAAMSNLGEVQVDGAINFNIGYAAYKAENLEGAVKYFNKAIEIGTNVPKCYEYLALAYNDKKDYVNAVANFEKAVETSTENTDALVYNAAIAAYRAKMMEKAIDLFGKSVATGYKGETAIYYKAAALKQLNKDVEYKAALEEGVEKFPGDDKIAPALASVYVTEGNELYKKGAAIITAANAKITAGSLKTSDVAYIAEVDKAKVEFKTAVEILEKAVALDSTNENAKKLIDACKTVL